MAKIKDEMLLEHENPPSNEKEYFLPKMRRYVSESELPLSSNHYRETDRVREYTTNPFN